MAEVEHFNHTFFVVDLVVNQERAVYQLPDHGPFADKAGHAWETAESIDVIEQRASKTGSCFFVIFSDMTYDLRQIAQRSLREEEAVIH